MGQWGVCKMLGEKVRAKRNRAWGCITWFIQSCRGTWISISHTLPKALQKTLVLCTSDLHKLPVSEWSPLTKFEWVMFSSPKLSLSEQPWNRDLKVGNDWRLFFFQRLSLTSHYLRTPHPCLLYRKNEAKQAPAAHYQTLHPSGFSSHFLSQPLKPLCCWCYKTETHCCCCCCCCKNRRDVIFSERTLHAVAPDTRKEETGRMATAETYSPSLSDHDQMW